eukprot:jgi/Chlat1/95/Chrsp1S03209
MALRDNGLLLMQLLLHHHFDLASLVWLKRQAGVAAGKEKGPSAAAQVWHNFSTNMALKLKA